MPLRRRRVRLVVMIVYYALEERSAKWCAGLGDQWKKDKLQAPYLAYVKEVRRSQPRIDLNDDAALIVFARGFLASMTQPAALRFAAE